MDEVGEMRFVVRAIVPYASERFCHVQRWPGSLTLCGMVDPTGGPPHRGVTVDGLCSYCGLASCITCDVLDELP